MKQEDPINSDATLQETLLAWRVTDRLPPRFGERVWQRIASQETQTPAAIWGQLSAWLGRAIARPSLAVSYITLLVLAGLAAGYWQARAEKNHVLRELESRYVQRVDPYQTRP